jgi:ATP synthase protein I
MIPSSEDDELQRARRELARQTATKQERKLEARRRGERSAWFGLGMFGLVGWSVALPSLVGVAIGLWIDTRWPSRFSWTLMMLFAGVAVGCLNAWWWVQRESRGPDV